MPAEDDRNETLRLEARGISATIDLSVGHIADLTIETGGRTLRPLHRAPWIGNPDADVPDELPGGVKFLSGDFLCAPFAANDVEPAPLHGWPANTSWSVVSSEGIDGGWQARLRLDRQVMGATIEKLLTLRDNHPFLYQEHRLLGGSGALSVAHHPMTDMSDGARLSFSKKRLAATPDKAPEPDASRGQSQLSYPARTADLTAFPAANGGTVDLTDYVADTRNEDFVTLVEADPSHFGWTAVARRAEADLLLVLKNPRDLPVTMLWISNGGRYYSPWNGRAGVLGIEDGRTALGHAASLGDNWLKAEGIATAFDLAEGGRVTFRQIVGALPVDPAGVPPLDLVAGDDCLHLDFPDGRRLTVPFDPSFLAPDRW